MSRLQGLLRFIGEAPGAVMGGLLGPSPIPPELAGQLPQGYDQQARQQAINNMSMQALSQPRGQLGNVLQGAQQGYQGSLINMLRGQEMAKAQQQADEERERTVRLRQSPELEAILGPLAQNLSPQTLEKVIAELATQQQKTQEPPHKIGATRSYEVGSEKVTEEWDGEKWVPLSKAPRWEGRSASAVKRSGIEGEILEKMRNGQELSPGEKAVLDHIARVSWLDRLLEQSMLGGGAP